MANLMQYADALNTLLWGTVGSGLILFMGLFLSCKARFMQVFSFHKIIKGFLYHCKPSTRRLAATAGTLEEPGTSPLRAFFASLGGCIGIGNLVTAALAVKIGGPGALVWIWVVAFLGMIIKYAEVYLGIKYRTLINGRYTSGPMYLVKKAFPGVPWLAGAVAFLLAIYGVEIFMFSVVTHSVSQNFNIPNYSVIAGLLVIVFWGVSGGVNRIGKMSSIAIPTFVLVFLGMTLWILAQHVSALPGFFKTIFTSAFTGHAAVGGFVGSSFLLVLSKGFSAAAYSGDVGIGYASMMHAEARTKDPADQASLAIFGIFLDTIVVCTCTVLLVYVTGVWQMAEVSGEMMVQVALSQYFPHMNIFMPIFLFCLAISTILPYMYAGLRSFEFILPKHGKKIYYSYALFAFIWFSFFEASVALLIMNLAGGLLIVINLPTLYKLRKAVIYKTL